MRISAGKHLSSIALIAALAAFSVSEAYAQGSNPNAGPGNNSGQGNTSPGSTGAARSGNDNAGPGNNSGQGNTSPGTAPTQSVGSTQTPGPESGHNCGGKGHINNDAPGHQHDDCDPITTGSTGGGAQARRGEAPMGGGAGQFSAADCTALMTPLFGSLTQEEVEILAFADQAVVVPVPCPEFPGDPEAQQAVLDNPSLAQALEARGYSRDKVIAAEARDSVPTIYVEAGP